MFSSSPVCPVFFNALRWYHCVLYFPVFFNVLKWSLLTAHSHSALNCDMHVFQFSNVLCVLQCTPVITVIGSLFSALNCISTNHCVLSSSPMCPVFFNVDYSSTIGSLQNCNITNTMSCSLVFHCIQCSSVYSTDGQSALTKLTLYNYRMKFTNAYF